MFEEHKRISSKCIHFLKMEEFGPHISNTAQLIEKMEKYEQRFDEALVLIENPSKAKS